MMPSKKVTALPPLPRYLQEAPDSDRLGILFHEAGIQKYEAWSQFHKPPYLGRNVAPNSVVEFGYPAFRGLIKVHPPLGPDNMLTMERLRVMAECYSDRWDMTKVATVIGLSLAEAVERFGPEGEFLDESKLPREQRIALRDNSRDFCRKFRGMNVPPSSQPGGYCKLHYWEEDATGRVVRRSCPRKDEESMNIQPGESAPVAVVAYLAWSFDEKFYYPVEWLAYLGEVVFKPLGRVLNGDLEWWDHESMGVIRVRNSHVSVVESFDHIIVGRGDDCDCIGCTKACEGGGPIGWSIPFVDLNVLRSGRDAERVKVEADIFSGLPQPCTWSTAAMELICKKWMSIGAASVLLVLPSHPPINQVCANPGDY